MLDCVVVFGIYFACGAKGGLRAISCECECVLMMRDIRWGFQLLFAITNQMLGFGLAGVCRRWLVWPAAMIWPSDLVNCALMYA